MNQRINIWLPLLLAIAVVIGMIAGNMLTRSSIHSPQNGKKSLLEFNKKPTTIEEVINIIEAKYVDPVNPEKIQIKAVNKILESLDPHSFYLSPEQLKTTTENLEGNFEGIGIEFFIADDTILVVSPISGGPSEALGIMAGDKIIYIEDSLVAGTGITNQEVIDRLRGPKGTQVTIKIKRKGIDDLIEYTITRDKIPIFSIDAGFMIDDGTGYIKINRFSKTTPREFISKLSELLNQRMRRLIIDVRQNPGGYLTAATEVVDELLEEKKLIVYTEGNAYPRIDYKTRKPGMFENGQLVILIDEGSASASEILAGAIQDWDRGVIVGRRSFGKGLVQEQFPLGNGGALRLTVARYYTPSGRCIQKPYNKGKSKYQRELVERLEKGEYFHPDSSWFADSLKRNTYKGRTVYAGGGIMPDVFVSADTMKNWRYLARIRQYVPQFVYDYYSDHNDEFSYSSIEQFMAEPIDKALFSHFLQYATDHGFSETPEETASLESDIRMLLKAYLARQLFGNDGYYRVMNQEDPAVKKALEILHDEAHYRQLLMPRATANQSVE